MKLLKVLFIVVLFVFFTGCAINKQIVGEFYLDQKKYDKGYKHFQEKLEENENDAYSNYYMGRFLLAKKQNKKALKYLKRAVHLEQNSANYYSWLGVAYSTQKEIKNERDAYLKALIIDKNHLQSLIYVAHNYYEKKEYENAYKYYTKSLKLDSYNQIVLFNRAMSLKKLKRTPEEKRAWKEYLDYYPSGQLSQRAVEFSNAIGNFDYVNYIIGKKTIILKQITFKAFTSKLNYNSYDSLDLLGKILAKKKYLSIHIVVYQQNNKNLAKEKAKAIKKYILEQYPKIEKKRLNLSWFNKSKKINSGNKQHLLGEYVNFITVI